MKQISKGKLNEKIEKALNHVLPSWYDYAFTSQIIGDTFFIDMTVMTTDNNGTIQVFMDVDRFDARKAVKVEIA